MLFFIRRGDGFLPVDKEPGSVLAPADLAVPLVRPTREQFETLSVEQIKAVFKAFGYAVSKGGVKSQFVAFTLNQWDEISAHALANVPRNYEACIRGTPKLFFYKKDDTYFMPVMIAPGQVMEMKTFDEMVSTPLTLSMANSLTIEQLNKVLKVLDAGCSDPKDGKKAIATRLVNFWAFNYERFNAPPSEVSDENSADSEEGVIPDTDTDTEEDIFSDTCNADLEAEFEQFCGMVPLDFEFYVNSAADFFANPVSVTVFTFKGDASMFSIEIDNLVSTGLDMKQEVLRHIRYFAEKKGNTNTMTVDDFLLTNGSMVIPDNEVVNGDFVREVYLVLRLRGGAPTHGVIKTIVKSKTSDKTTQLDASKFQNAFAHATGLSGASTDNIKSIINGLSVETLQTMQNYIEHGRTPNKSKPAGLAMLLPPVAEMEEVRGKLNTAIEDAKGLMVAFLQKSCGDGNDGIKMVKVLQMIETRLGVIEELSKVSQVTSADATMRN